MSETMLEQQLTQLLQMAVFGWVMLLTADEKESWLFVDVGRIEKKQWEIFSSASYGGCCSGRFWCISMAVCCVIIFLLVCWVVQVCIMSFAAVGVTAFVCC